MHSFASGADLLLFFFSHPLKVYPCKSKISVKTNLFFTATYVVVIVYLTHTLSPSWSTMPFLIPKLQKLQTTVCPSTIVIVVLIPLSMCPHLSVSPLCCNVQCLRNYCYFIAPHWRWVHCCGLARWLSPSSSLLLLSSLSRLHDLAKTKS